MDTSRPAGSGRRGVGRGIRTVAGFPLVAASLVGASVGASSLASAGPAAAASGGSAPMVTVVAQFAPGARQAGAVAAAATGGRAHPAPAGRYVAEVPASQAPAAVAALRAQPGVRYAEVARPVHAMDVSIPPNDPCYSAGCVASGSAGPLVNQAYLQTIGAPQAWPLSTGAGVTVAVLDTGVDPSHEDLQGKIVGQTNVCGADPQCADSSADDDNGHGTHVTGILAADTNNMKGVASLGWDVKVDEYKVLDQNGNGFTADVDTAIYDAVANHDRVINLSLANYSCQQSPADCGPDPDEQAAVEYAIAHNVVVVAAAGNGIDSNPGDDGLTYPASYPGVLGVAATDDSGVVPAFSQWGRAANIAAPGVGIISTWDNGGYAVDTGTSMSAPQVAAAAALVMARNPYLTGPQVTQLLESTAAPTRGGRPINGGLLDVPAALDAAATPPTSYLGYVMAASNGSAYPFGSVGGFGDVSGVHLTKPVVGVALQPNGLGYWMVASDGGIFSFGAARFHGSTGGVTLNKPVVGMAPTPDGGGYWLVAADGGVFAFGDARFHGSTGGVTLNEPVVGMASTPDGGGYWLVAADGGVFAFGDARFHGSTGGVTLDKPVVGLARTADGGGYWLVASDGGVFSFGDARFHGSTGNVTLAQPVVGLTATPDSRGYWMVASDGGVFNFGDARFYGSAGGAPIPGPVVGVAS